MIDCLENEGNEHATKSIKNSKCGNRLTINLEEGYPDFHSFISSVKDFQTKLRKPF